MMKTLPFIEDRLLVGEPVMLIAVIEVHGSSPGKKGFKMAVDGDGKTVGSIGGGLMEYNMVNLARAELLSDKTAPFLKRQVHSANAGEDASGLICAGEQKHAFIPIFPYELDKVRSMIRHLEDGKEGILELSPKGLTLHKTAGKQSIIDMEPASLIEWRYLEPLVPPATLYIFGGGHISIPMSRIFSMLGFRVVVLDDREGLVTMQNNKFAHLKKNIDYGQAASHINYPLTSYVCIMTVSHASDQVILEQMLPLPLKYLGMIGSKNKVQKIFSNLSARGAKPGQLQRVNSPMGIQINSETPEEIAISIAAQIIQQKNAQKQGH